MDYTRNHCLETFETFRVMKQKTERKDGRMSIFEFVCIFCVNEIRILALFEKF